MDAASKMLGLTENAKPKQYALGFAAFLTIPLSYYFMTRKKKQGRRRMSFTSVALGLGSFPPAAQVTEPIINTAIYFDECPEAEEVAENVIKPLLAYERLAQVPDLKNHTMRPSQKEVKPMDMIRQLDIEGDEKVTDQTIVDHCQDTLGDGRDDLPWWEILMIRNSGTGSSVCVLRIHHVIGDGLAVVAVFQKIITNEKGGPAETPLSFKSPSSSTTKLKTKKKKNPLMMAMSLIEATFHCLTLGVTKYDDDTHFSKMNHSQMKHSGKREAIIFPAIPLDFVKKLKTAANVTVNDLCMAAVSQAIHNYCKSQNDPVLEEKQSKLQCRALLPAGFPRSIDDEDFHQTALRNIWCMVSCDMGVGYSDIMDRIQHIHSKTQEMKEKPRAFMQLKIQNGLGPYVPIPIGQQTVFDTFSRHSLVLTNVPAFLEKTLFAGKVVQKLQVFFDNLLTQVSMISYAGKLYGNVMFDAKELPDSDSFGKHYAGAFVDLADRLDVDVPPEVKKAAD